MGGFCVLYTRFSLILEDVVWEKNEKRHWIYPTLVYLILRRYLPQFQHHAQQFPFRIFRVTQTVNIYVHNSPFKISVDDLRF